MFYLALNKPWEEGADVDGEAVVEIIGEKMYLRVYTKEGGAGSICSSRNVVA